jgi:hypothetical protein
MTTQTKVDIHRIFFEERELVHEAVRQGVRDAMLRHKKARQQVVIYRDGKTVWVHPKELGA